MIVCFRNGQVRSVIVISGGRHEALFKQEDTQSNEIQWQRLIRKDEDKNEDNE